MREVGIGLGGLFGIVFFGLLMMLGGGVALTLIGAALLVSSFILILWLASELLK